MQKVIIIGAGFGGLRAARMLAGKGVDVLLIDQHNYHCFQPLLYQVATAGLEPEQIIYPVRAIIRKWQGVRFLMAQVQRIERSSRQVHTSMGAFDYDHLIIAAGGKTNFFGMESVAKYGFGLKTIDDAVNLRNHILRVFEQATYEQDRAKRAAMQTFVIVGGGPTGVELAGAIYELIRHVLVEDFPGLHMDDVQVQLLEATDSILTMLPKKLQQRALERLRKIGVHVRLNTAVTAAALDHVQLKDGSTIPAHTLIWAAGVHGVEIVTSLEVAIQRGNRVAVTPELNLADDPYVYVIGDLAALEQAGKPLPQVAPVAMQQGETAATNILRRRKHEKAQPFRYKDRGSMATIGRNAAVAHVFGISFWGFSAWVVWLFVHLMSLVGFRNRLIVLINWAYNYISYERAIRVIA